MTMYDYEAAARAVAPDADSQSDSGPCSRAPAAKSPALGDAAAETEQVAGASPGAGQLKDTDGVGGRVTIRQVLKVWRSASSGAPRVVVLRLGYRAVGNDWGHAGGGGRTLMRISEQGVGADECAVAALCVALAAVEPDDQVFIIAPFSVAALIRSLVEARSVVALAATLRPYVAPYLARLGSASIEVRNRQGMRDMFRKVSAGTPARAFASL
ncbi:hypothetical protein ABZ379_06825 [Streptomyces canus]|uniref:hypothetical protein n=1 Tax=Streptomyces canus TaxID=58343 RepID=UPI003404A9C1